MSALSVARDLCPPWCVEHEWADEARVGGDSAVWHVGTSATVTMDDREAVTIRVRQFEDRHGERELVEVQLNGDRGLEAYLSVHDASVLAAKIVLVADASQG